MKAQHVGDVLQQVATAERPLGLLRKRVLLVGTGRLAREVGAALAAGGDCEVLGCVDREPAAVPGTPPVIGTFTQLFELVERFRVSTIAVCTDDRRGGLPLQTLLDCKALGIEVLDGHRLYEEKTGRLSLELLKPGMLVFSEGFRRHPAMMGLKRLLDLLVAAAGLVLFAPLFAALAWLIVLDSPGPVFYRQTRIGLLGAPYVMWKFRSMRRDAEEAGAARWAGAEDPRVTGIGRWMRRWRVDELPQLYNVLKGDMSLVGPRPERPAFVQELRSLIPYYDLRHTIRPGITGWAQVRFRYGASVEDAEVKLQYDLYYLKHLSLAFDLRIILHTIRVVLQGAGAR